MLFKELLIDNSLIIFCMKLSCTAGDTMVLVFALLFNNGTNMDMPMPSKSAVMKLVKSIRNTLNLKCS